MAVFALSSLFAFAVTPMIAGAAPPDGSSLAGWPWVEPSAPATEDAASPDAPPSDVPPSDATESPESSPEPAPGDAEPEGAMPETRDTEFPEASAPAIAADGQPIASAPSSAVTSPAVVATAAPAPTRPDRPIRWRLDASLGVAATRVTDDGFAGLSRRPSVLGAAPMVRFDWRLRPQGHIFVGGGVLYRGTRRGTSVLDGSVDTELRMDETLGFVRLSLMAIDGIDMFVDAGAGPSFARVDVSSSSSTVSGETRDVLFAADAAAGLALYLPKAWLPHKKAGRTTGGVTASIGYTLREPMRVDPTLKREDDAIRIDAPPLGDVTMRGLSWRLGVFVRFM